MRLKTLFFLLALLLIVVWGILLVLALESGKALFYVGEGVTTLSLIVLVYFYRKLVMPLNSIANGIDLLREQDFSSRLSKVGQAEADRIVTMFNGMMDQLKNERLRLREQNHFLDLLISVSPMGVIILDFDGKVSMLNTAALRFLGYTSQTDLIGKNFSALDAPLAEEINYRYHSPERLHDLSLLAPFVCRSWLPPSVYPHRESDVGSGEGGKESI